MFALVVLFLAVRAVRATPALTWVAVGIGLPLIALTILEVADPLNGQVVLSSSILHAVFYFYTTFALIRYMFLDRFVTTDEIWAVGATFTVVAWAFAYMFMAVQVIWPGSFTAAIAPDAPRTWFELLFLSFTNLTSVGLSDITPVLPHARSWVMIEQVAGLMYVALVVSRVVGLTISRQRVREPRRRRSVDHNVTATNGRLEDGRRGRSTDNVKSLRWLGKRRVFSVGSARGPCSTPVAPTSM